MARQRSGSQQRGFNAPLVAGSGKGLIVSCHVPKTAGTTFGALLDGSFGRAVVSDYGDRVGWIGPEATRWREARPLPERLTTRYRIRRVRAVHGHFYTSKYAAIWPDADLVAFVREPVARVVSNYHYLRDHPEIGHPVVAEFHSARPELVDWVTWPWTRNLQSSVLDVDLDRFTLIGLTEQFAASVSAFDRIFGTELATLQPDVLNVSENRLEVDADTVATIQELNQEDLELYRIVSARFAERWASPTADDHVQQ